MKKLLPALFLLGAFAWTSSVCAYENPGRPTGFVNDFAGMLSASEKSQLEATLVAFEKETSIEISVATVKSLGGDTAENFSSKLFEDWSIGKKGADNGLLFLIAPVEKELRIEVGYGLEPLITDAAASTIVRTVVLPLFREEKYSEGVRVGVDSITQTIRKDSGALHPEASTAKGLVVNWEQIILIVLLLLALSTRWGRHILFAILWSGIGRGGQGGGGFGGFGGGRSGGGGAGGKW